MGEPLCSYDNVIREVSATRINRVYDVFSDGVHFAKPVSSLRTNEVDVVRGVLQMLQGLSSSLFYWDPILRSFCVKSGVYLTHLSKGSLHRNLDQFVYAATCLQLVGIVVEEIERSAKAAPTLRAFANSVSMWLKWLRDIALKEEVNICKVDAVFTPTLLGLASSLSSLCSGAEYLLQIVNGAIPQDYFEPNFSVPNAEVAVHVLDYLYQRLDEISLVQGSQEEVYQRLLHIFVGSLLPYIEYLDSWLYEGSVNDPFEELFFYANKSISLDATDFWDKSYQVRQSQIQKPDIGPSVHAHAVGHVALADEKKDMVQKEFSTVPTSTKGKNHNSSVGVCPLFFKDMARSIVSAGKSLQLIRHVSMTCALVKPKEVEHKVESFRSSSYGNLSKIQNGPTVAGLSLSEVFCVSLAGLLGHGEHVSRYFWKDDNFESKTASLFESCEKIQGTGKEAGESLNTSEKLWQKFLVDTLRKRTSSKSESLSKEAGDCQDATGENMDVEFAKYMPLLGSFCPINPVISMCQSHLKKCRDYGRSLNISRNFYLPPLNDELLHKSIFSGEGQSLSFSKGTNFSSGFQFCESEFQRIHDDTRLLEELFPFPTLLPCFEDGLHMSELLPLQKGSTLSSKVLNWLQNAEARTTPLPIVIMQECLHVYIKRQVDLIGRHMLSKLMTDWRLMDELAVLRAIYLLGSGDLLQHFLTVIFTKLDRGESWDDDFELNMILQESIRNSADSMLLSAPDSLEVSITKGHDVHDSEQHNLINVPSTPRKTQASSFGIDGLKSLSFSYKVSWPLELIANTEALKNYNKVMGFLLKVKRAKFVLDKARRWIWKGRGTAANSRKRHWLLEQKLLHFVDAFHQYIMDRVYHSAWRELCEGMTVAGSLDEVMEVHAAYLLSIQRQCFVVPDKLGALVASRINTILGLALDFYSIQQTLSSGGAVSATKARCEMEVDRIEKQFDDCIAFLLRVLSFRLNVGNFPHLADLVTRINYNYFYMSESGNLATAPGSEMSSKLGKAFAGRRE